MKIEFSTDNAAFVDDRMYEFGVIFDRITAKLMGGADSGKIHDSNGNSIGAWSL